MKKKLLLIFVLIYSLNGFAKKTVGGQIAVHLYIDANCNKMPDKGEFVTNGFTATLTGANYNKTINAITNEALFTSLNFGTYTASVSYPYTYANGTRTTLSSTGSITISAPSIETIDVLLNPCNPPELPTSCGSWSNAKLSTGSSFDVSGNTMLNSNSALTITKYNTVLSFNGLYKGTISGKENSCDITGTITNPNGGITNWTNNFTITANIKGTYVINYKVLCGDKVCETGSKQIINDTEEEKELPKDLCGVWQTNTIVTTLNGKNVGEYAINSKNSFNVALLNTEISFNGVYKWTFEKRTGNCKITGTIIEPDGNKINWSNNFYIKVRKPGTYSISYQIKCVESICEAGVKVFTCNDVVVCNCAPQQSNSITARNVGAKGAFKTFMNGDSIIIDKKYKPTFSYSVKCEGNVCDDNVTYQLTNSLGQVVGGLSNGYFSTKIQSGFYTLEIKGYCGGKNCSNLKFPVRVFGADKKKQTVANVHSRWGNQIGVNFGWPKFEKMKRDKNYTGIMVGLIADLPFGAYKRLHFWPAINVATAKFSGTEKLVSPSGTSVSAIHKQLLVRFGADISYAFPVGKKDAKFHIYAGANASGAIIHKSTYTALPTTALGPWTIANKSDSAQKLSFNFNAGILFDINKTWTIGANYYTYFVPASTIMYTPLTDRGLSIRLAWFYNQQKNGARTGR
jgi:hypothetical protein